MNELATEQSAFDKERNADRLLSPRNLRVIFRPKIGALFVARTHYPCWLLRHFILSQVRHQLGKIDRCQLVWSQKL